MKQKIPMEKWYWMGLAKHFICADRCRFHMATKVGKYIISTVGNYVSSDSNEFEEIGYGRKFETFVFRAGKATCDCCKYQAIVSGGELDSLPANDVKTAEKNHMNMCLKFAGLKD